MKAIRINRTGDAGVLELEEVADPALGPGQARVKVEAAGLNFIDIYQRSGAYNIQAPFTPGMEGAGVVEAVADDVTGLQPGERVAWTMQTASYAEYVSLPADKLVPVPNGISAAQAASVMLQGLTAHYLCHSTYPIHTGDTAVVTAAAGGVGHLLVQMIKRAGGWVAATVSTEVKAELARAAGADEVILYTQTSFDDKVREFTGGAGVHVVYDSVGKTTFEQSLNSLRPRGYLVLYGQASGPVPPFDPQILNQKGSLFLTRPSLGAYVPTRAELLARSEDVFGWILAGELEVRIDKQFPLAQAADAHRYMEGRQTKGKVLLIP